MIFKDGQRVLFIGDSITDCGRTGPLAPYGDGYVNLLRALVTARHPATDLTWLNRGVSGDTVRHLRARWDRDAVAERPDWLSIMIGINDVWRAFGDRPDEAVPIDEYESTLRALLTEVDCPIIVGTPYFIEPDRTDAQRARSDLYADVARRVAADFGALLVDTQAMFDRLLEHRAPSAWAPDRVHPGLEGHTALALAFLDVIESD
ncbi:SGNH/GDSL hydrolase family protein [Dactylosporangium sp. NPDC049140]|jgi:lysophospholipase L1-like esterase|uniref:SGNH/GDSL hydrolase family protein n=1 Tax=Dactylosporangium sp. NPDC049140 TaxID=3155647 RepID=UPI0033EA863D